MSYGCPKYVLSEKKLDGLAYNVGGGTYGVSNWASN